MAADDLTTWADAQTFIGAGATDEAMVGTLITAASQWCNNYCSRKLASREYTAADIDDVIYDGDGSNYMLLTQYPITTLTSVHLDDDHAFPADTLIAATDYTYNPDRGRVVLYDDIFDAGIGNVKILYTAGYTTIPSDLATACLMIVDLWYKGFSNHMWGVSAVGVDDQRIDYIQEIPAMAKMLLQAYRKSVC